MVLLDMTIIRNERFTFLRTLLTSDGTLDIKELS